MNWKALFLIPLLILLSLNAGAEDQGKGDMPDILTVIKDETGEVLEGILRSRPEEVNVSTRDNQEKTIPSKFIKSIALERVTEEIPGKDPRLEARYSVRVENSQEIYTLKKKYTLSLNTSLGMVTRTIDPETVNNIFFKETSQTDKAEKDKPFVQDKSIVFSLEFKF
ncbi:MAG: hypothetical protein HXY45_11825 [Syntrophaceae bacterium]|nr:hypothetical protein [Syntrophaceae bacterium]